jgi:hypothetical protein
MTLKEMQSRLTTLEKEVDALRAEVHTAESTNPNPIAWWTLEGGAGRFASDPHFEEMCRLGREYRKSIAGKRNKKGKRPRTKTHAGS